VRIISVTRLRLRSIRFLPSLYWVARKLRQSLEKAPGFLIGKFLADRNRVFWTMSVWKDVDSMRAFRNSRVHAAVMPNVTRWCDEASVVHWETEAGELPEWNEAHRRMSESGKPVPLKFQSADHKAGKYKKPYVYKDNWRFVMPGKQCRDSDLLHRLLNHCRLGPIRN
jgi:Domain of unknown function (DUF3291)